MPQAFKTENGVHLGAWVQIQRRNKNQLTQDKIYKLESLEGWVGKVIKAGKDERC